MRRPAASARFPWLDNHEPSDLLDEVKRFARRRPATFLALAAAAGVVAGRVTRGAVAANTSVDSDDSDVTPARAYDRGGYQSGGAYGAATRPAMTRATARSRVKRATRAADRLRGSTPRAHRLLGYPTTGPSYPDVTPASDETYTRRRLRVRYADDGLRRSGPYAAIR